MAKRQRLRPQTSTKLNLFTVLKYSATAGAFAGGVFLIVFLYNSLGTSTEMLAGVDFGNYQFNRTIAVDAQKVTGPGPHKDFPLFLDISENYLKNTTQGGGVEDPEGGDIIFVDQQGEPLHFQIEYYNKDEGRLVAWVKIPQLSTEVDTKIKMYFGNKNATSDKSGDEVWVDQYKGVWHLNGDASDATSKNSHGESIVAEGTVGILAGALNFDGKSSYIDVKNYSELQFDNKKITLSAWVKWEPEQAKGWTPIVMKTSAGNWEDGYGLFIDYDDQLKFYVNKWNENYASIAFPRDAKWHFVVGTYDGTEVNIYMDGEMGVPSLFDGAISPANQTLKMGMAGSGGAMFKGAIDEVRMMESVKSAGWIQTEYANQSSPETFYRIVYENTLMATTVKGGQWNDIETWDCKCVPSPGSVVEIRHQVTLENGAASVRELHITNFHFSKSADLIIRDEHLSVAGDFSIQAGKGKAESATLTLEGTADLLVSGNFSITRSAENESASAVGMAVGGDAKITVQGDCSFDYFNASEREKATEIELREQAQFLCMGNFFIRHEGGSSFESRISERAHWSIAKSLAVKIGGGENFELHLGGTGDKKGISVGEDLLINKYGGRGVSIGMAGKAMAEVKGDFTVDWQKSEEDKNDMYFRLWEKARLSVGGGLSMIMREGSPKKNDLIIELEDQAELDVASTYKDKGWLLQTEKNRNTSIVFKGDAAGKVHADLSIWHEGHGGLTVNLNEKGLGKSNLMVSGNLSVNRTDGESFELLAAGSSKVEVGQKFEVNSKSNEHSKVNDHFQLDGSARLLVNDKLKYAYAGGEQGDLIFELNENARCRVGNESATAEVFDLSMQQGRDLLVYLDGKASLAVNGNAVLDYQALHNLYVHLNQRKSKGEPSANWLVTGNCDLNFTGGKNFRVYGDHRAMFEVKKDFTTKYSAVNQDARHYYLTFKGQSKIKVGGDYRHLAKTSKENYSVFTLEDQAQFTVLNNMRINHQTRGNLFVRLNRSAVVNQGKAMLEVKGNLDLEHHGKDFAFDLHDLAQVRVGNQLRVVAQNNGLVHGSAFLRLKNRSVLSADGLSLALSSPHEDKLTFGLNGGASATIAKDLDFLYDASGSVQLFLNNYSKGRKEDAALSVGGNLNMRGKRGRALKVEMAEAATFTIDRNWEIYAEENRLFTADFDLSDKAQLKIAGRLTTVNESSCKPTLNLNLSGESELKIGTGAETKAYTSENVTAETMQITGNSSIKIHGDYNLSSAVNLNAAQQVVSRFSLVEDSLYLAQGATLLIENLSAGATTYHWEFGDGQTAADFQPKHSYKIPGAYIVKLKASNTSCSDYFEVPVFVFDEVTGWNDND